MMLKKLLFHSKTPLFLMVLLVAGVSVFLFRSDKKFSEVEEEPSFEYSLRLKNKKITSYRSPASIRAATGRNRPGLNKSITKHFAGDERESAFSDESSSAASDNKSANYSPSPFVAPLPGPNFRGQESAPESQNNQSAKAEAFQPSGGFFPEAPVTSPKDSAEEASGSNRGDDETPPSLRGKVSPLQGVIAFRFPNPLIQSAYANSCTDPRILLLDLTNMSILLDNPISEEGLSSTTSFSFDPLKLNLEISNPSRYMLQTKGCTTNFQRIITSFYSPQDLDFSTTLVSKVVYTALAPTIQSANTKMLENLYGEISQAAGPVSSFETAYNQVWNSPSINDFFGTAFSSGNMQDLESAAPDVEDVTYFTNLDEKSSYSFSVNAFHWRSSYVIAYEWQVDGVTVSTAPNWTYIPNADSPSSAVVTLIIGHKNTADSLVDRSLVYHQIDWDVIINDTFPATPPAMALSSTSTNPSGTKSIDLEIATGALVGGVYSNCESFESFAITEDSAIPTASDFTYSCSNGPLETLSYTINKAIDGIVTLKLWVKDSEGRVSETSSDVSLVVDTSNPIITFSGISSAYVSDEDATFDWTLTESHSSSSQNFTLDFYDGASWISLPAVPVTDGPHAGTTFNTTYHVPNVSATDAKIRVTYTDLLGHQTIAESSAFAINRPLLGATPSPLDLGAIKNLETTSDFTLNFTNSGPIGSKVCGPIVLSGTHASDFTIVTDSCDGTTIASGGSCPLTVKATPSAKGTRSSTATITCGNDTFAVNLTLVSENNVHVLATPISGSFNEDNTHVITFGPATDADGDTLTYTVVSAPGHGSISSCGENAGNYQCTFTPAQHYNGSDSFTFKANDGTSDTNTAIVNLSIAPVNDAPVLATTQSVSTAEDTDLNFALNAANDVENNILTYSIVSPPATGTLSCTDVNCTYTPPLNFVGSTTFTYKANDGTVDSNTATVTITVTNENDPPVIGADQTLATNEDMALNFTINSATDVDVPAQTLSYKIISAPQHGTLSNCINASTWTTDLSCTYNPDSNYYGTDIFTVRANDGVSDSVAVETITITINPVNDAPTLVATQAISVSEDSSVTFDLGLGSDVESDPLAYTKLTNTSNGTITCTGGTSRSCTYTPNANFEGTDTFSYKVNDGALDSNTATVTITVTPTNDPPVIGADQTLATNEDTALNFSLNAATDIDVPAQTISYKIISAPLHGTISNCINTSGWQSDISCTYAPDANWNGTDSFTVRANDGVSDSVADATVTITVNAVNDAPTLAATQAVSTTEDTAVTFDLTAGSDVENSSLTYTKLTNTSNGTITCTGGTSRSCTYTPNADFEGTDSFTYKVNDGSLDSTTATVTITVAPANDPPVPGADQTIAATEDTSVSFTLNSGSDVDVPAQTLTYILVSGPSRGSLSGCIATGSYSTDLTCDYTPNANLNGPDSFTYRAYDSVSESVSYATVTINVAAVNDAPVAAADPTFSTRDNFAYSFNLPAGTDVDTSVASLTYKLVSAPAAGTLTGCISTAGYSGDLSCTYTAPVNHTGAVTFTYLVHDGSLDSATETTVTINVSDQTSTTPNLTPYNFASTVSTSNNPVTLTAASCTDISFIMIQESSTAPLATDSGWQSCTTALGGMAFDPSVSNQQGFRTLRIYGKDSSGNISSPQLVNFIFDSMAPIIAIDNIPTLPNGISYPVRWRLTEATVLSTANFSMEYSLDNGSSWTSAGTLPVGQNGPHSSTLYTYEWPVPAGTYANAKFRVSLTDSNGLSTTTTSNTFTILVDTNAPNFLVSEMKINGSATPPSTPQKYVSVSLSALDGDTDITHFCLKNHNSAPAGNDSCWKAVDAPSPGLSPSTSLNLVDFPFLLGYVPATYSVYAWAKDRSGNISLNTGTLGQDMVTITYYSDTAPVLTNFFAVNSTTPTNPISSTDMTFNLGSPIYIKWTAQDDFGVTSTIKLYYTTDDVTYNLIADNVANSSNNCGSLNDPGTSVDDSSTGCYQWASPVGSTQYFKIKILVSDTASQQVSATSAPLNSSNFRVLAGNTDPGVNSSAKSAIIAPFDSLAPYSIAASSDGKVFYRDAVFGLMYVNPQTGVVEQLLKVTGSVSGDNGPVRSATAARLNMITIDFQDRLIIWDYNRIRRIDTKTEPMQIETIIGAQNNGATGTQTTDTVTDPADLQLSPSPAPYNLLQPLPNGDIYFQSGPFFVSENSGNILRIYRGSLPEPRIESIHVSGTGAYHDFQGVPVDLSTDPIVSYHVTFDVNTSAVTKIMAKIYKNPDGCSWYSLANIDTVSYVSTAPHPPAHVSTCGDIYDRTGNDGNFYRINSSVAWANKISRYNSATNSYDRIYGNDSQGYCADGTAAVSCKSKIVDIFVTPDGKKFVLDNSVIRVIDDSGNVQTLYGQTKSYGDNGLAQDARFNTIPYISHGVGDNVIAYDGNELTLREIRPNSPTAQIVRLAGNGESASVDFGIPAASQTLNAASWDQPGTVVTNPITGDVFFPCIRGIVCKLNRATGFWENVAGGGSVNGTATGTIAAADVRFGGYNVGLLAYHNGRIITGQYDWSGTASMDSIFRELDLNTNISHFMAGKTEVLGVSGCPDGSGSGCNLGFARGNGKAYTYYPALDGWLFRHHGNDLKVVKTDTTTGTGHIEIFKTMPEGIQNMVWNGSTLYYCTDSGYLKKMEFPSETVTVLPFPGAMYCAGSSMLFKPASGDKPDRLIFSFVQNGLWGVGEYFL